MTCPFKPGDRVRCIKEWDAAGKGGVLNHEYTVIEAPANKSPSTAANFYTKELHNEGQLAGVMPERFELVAAASSVSTPWKPGQPFIIGAKYRTRDGSIVTIKESVPNPTSGVNSWKNIARDEAGQSYWNGDHPKWPGYANGAQRGTKDIVASADEPESEPTAMTEIPIGTTRLKPGMSVRLRNGDVIKIVHWDRSNPNGEEPIACLGDDKKARFQGDYAGTPGQINGNIQDPFDIVAVLALAPEAPQPPTPKPIDKEAEKQAKYYLEQAMF
jgi:hypothetical protein